MILDTLSLIVNHLNDHLKHRYASSEDVAILASIPKGSELDSSNTLNKIVVSVVSIEQPADLNKYKPMEPGLKPGLNMNVNVLFAANFKDDRYSDSLKYLENVIQCLHASPVFSRVNTSGLPESIDQISCEMVHLSIQEQSHLWMSLGRNYLPSVLFRLRIQSIAKSN